MSEEQNLISFDYFTKVIMRVGTIVNAIVNEKARNPAFILTIDFGSYGIKTSSAQITEHYTTQNLVGKQIIAVMNFPPKKVAGIISEVLVLASVSENEGTVLLQPSHKVSNGSRIL